MHHRGSSDDDAYRAPVHLVAGRNLLIVEVENHGYGCHLVGRISAVDGSAIQSAVTLTTDPRR